MKKLIFILVLILFPLSLFAQKGTINQRVKDLEDSLQTHSNLTDYLEALSCDLIPASDVVRNLGSASKHFKMGFIDSITSTHADIGNITINEDTIKPKTGHNISIGAVDDTNNIGGITIIEDTVKARLGHNIHIGGVDDSNHIGGITVIGDTIKPEIGHNIHIGGVDDSNHIGGIVVVGDTITPNIGHNVHIGNSGDTTFIGGINLDSTLTAKKDSSGVADIVDSKLDTLSTGGVDSSGVVDIIEPYLLDPTQYPAFLYIDPDSNMVFLSKPEFFDSSGVSDSLADKLPKDFTTLTKYEGTNDADYIPVMPEGEGTTKYMEMAKMPVSTAVADEFVQTVQEADNKYATKESVDGNGNIITALQTQVNELSEKLDSLCHVVETMGNPFPTCPTNVAGTGYIDSIRVTWTNSSDDFDSTALYYGVLNADNWSLKWINKDSSGNTLTGLTASTPYEIYLKHRNGSVYSEPSARITVLTLPSGGAGDLADYYVNYDGGSDTSDGLTEATAWKHCPGDPLATGVPLSRNLVAGDTVLFKGGVEYLGQIIIDGDGTSSDSIVFLGNKGWGTGRAIFDMGNTRQYAFTGGRDYIKIQGINFFNYATAGSNYVLFPTTGASNWNIDSCTIAFVQGWATVGPSISNKACIMLTNSTSNITIQNSEFFANGRTAVYLRYTSGVDIINNNFGGISRGDSTGYISVAIRGEVSSNNVSIRGNTFHDCWQYGGDVYPEIYHAPSAIHIYGTEPARSYNPANDPSNYTIEKNYFYNNKLIAYGSGTSDIQISTDAKNMVVKNNLLVNTETYNSGNILLSDGCDSIGVYNNTFIMRDYSGSGTGEMANNIVIYTHIQDQGLPTEDDRRVGDSVWVENNIFYNDNNTALAYNVRLTWPSNSFKGIIDYNAYYNIDASTPFYTSSGSVSFNTWKTYGYDANSNFYTTGTTIFTTLPATGATSSSGDYTLSNYAPVFLKTGGLTIPSVTDDFNGNTRTAGYSLGAFEK